MKQSWGPGSSAAWGLGLLPSWGCDLAEASAVLSSGQKSHTGKQQGLICWGLSPHVSWDILLQALPEQRRMCPGEVGPGLWWPQPLWSKERQPAEGAGLGSFHEGRFAETRGPRMRGGALVGTPVAKEQPTEARTTHA